MTNRRLDAFYLPIFLAVMAGGWWLSSRPSEEGEALALPDFSMPGIELEIPFELPYTLVRFRRPEPPTLELRADTEAVIAQVRRALLESSARDESDVEVLVEAATAPQEASDEPERLAAMFD